MALFGSGMKSRTMSDVTPYRPTLDERGIAVSAMPATRPASRGIFGAPMQGAPAKAKPNWGHILVDALAGGAGQPGPFAAAAAQRRAFEDRLALANAEREASHANWVRQREYDRDNPDDQFTRYMQAAGIDPRSPQGQALYRQRAESMAAPPMVAVDGFDAQGNPTKTFMPRAGIGGMGSQGAPSGPMPGTVRNGYRFNGGNPNDRNSWVPVGGAPSAGGATFR